MEIDALPKVIRGRGVEIRIDAPILSDAEAIKAACAEALQHVSQMMVGDVINVHKDSFADRPGHNTITDYGGAESYYSSGMIPFWRGGLAGSFADVGSDNWDDRNLSFTESYALQVEQGGGRTAFSQEWAQDKLDMNFEGEGQTYSTHPHPFVETVAQKLQDNLEGFGYLSAFASTFVGHFNAYA